MHISSIFYREGFDLIIGSFYYDSFWVEMPDLV
jgi:hypothetical protein